MKRWGLLLIVTWLKQFAHQAQNRPHLGDQVLECLQVDNSRVVERALFLFKDDGFLDMLAASKHTSFPPLVSALVRGGEPFWNPTVNKVGISVEMAIRRSRFSI